MKSKFITSFKDNFFLRKALMIFVGLGVAIFLFWYVNTYIYKFFASGEPVSVSMTPTKEEIDLSGKSEEEFNIAFEVSQQDVSGMELYLTYDADYLQYGKEYSDTGFIQPENFQYDVLLEEVAPPEVSIPEANLKQVKIILVATTEIPAELNNSRLLNFKFKAVAAEDQDTIENITQKISLSTQSQFVGANDQGEAAQFGNPTEPVLASVTIYRGTGSDLTPTVTGEPGEPTPTDTASGPKFVFEPSSTSIKKGQSFGVNINIDPGSEAVAGADIYLDFDPELLTLETVVIGSYFPLVANVPSTGRLYIAATVENQGDSKTGTGTIATVTFKAAETGTANIVIDCDPAKTDSSRLSKNDINATNILNCSALKPHTVTITAQNDPTPTTDDVPSPTPTTGSFSGEKADVQLNMKVRFQGIVKQPDAAFDRLNVRVDIEGSQGYKNDQVVEFKADGSGLWSGVMKIEKVPISQKYAVLIKGPKHLSRKICEVTPRENVPGTYKCESGGDIELKAGGNNLDFSQIVVLAGDIPTQNQVVDSADIIFIRQNFGNTSPSALSRGDLNLDGIIDTQDYSLVMAALGFKYDEEL